jgi:hypothetical protein
MIAGVRGVPHERFVTQVTWLAGMPDVDSIASGRSVLLGLVGIPGLV